MDIRTSFWDDYSPQCGEESHLIKHTYMLAQIVKDHKQVDISDETISYLHNYAVACLILMEYEDALKYFNIIFRVIRESELKWTPQPLMEDFAICRILSGLEVNINMLTPTKRELVRGWIGKEHATLQIGDGFTPYERIMLDRIKKIYT
jgi:hypothetical protein